MTWVAVGTAAAVGAGVGGVSAAAQGKSGNEILEGALIGGVTGAVTGGAGAAASGLTSTAGTLGTELGKEVAKEAVTEVGKEAVKEGATQVAQEAVKEGATQTLVEAAPQAVQEAAVNPQGILQASGPATSDVASGQMQDQLVNKITTATPDQMVPQTELSPEVLKISGNAPTSTPTPAPEAASNFGIKAAGPNPSATGPLDTGVKPMIQSGNPSYPSTMGNVGELPTPQITPTNATNGIKLGTTAAPTENGFMQGFSQFAKDNPFLTGAGIYATASATGMLDQNGQEQPTTSGSTYTGPTLSKDFKGGPYSEPNIYKPRYAAEGGIMQLAQGGMATGPVERMSANALGGTTNMYPQSQQERTNFATPTQMPASAEVTMDNQYQGVTMAQGGIASVPRYYRGRLATSDGGRGDVYGATQRFLDMYDPQAKYTPPSDATNPDVGIFHDSNPSTRSKSALDASETRQNALEKRANIKSGARYVPASRSMGELSFKAPGEKDDKEKDYDSVLAASGGIMQANLGGYAAGGNPRLLRGPGDGMSDDIPATIGGRQPARLADGEFVVPADVVSHLGNGSTEAGAKKLHQMMNKVRMDRTGKKKQAPAVKAGKYIPK